MGKKYNIIYCDAPWQYQNWTAKKNGAAKAHYNGLTTEELCALPVKDIAADNCALFFWITHPKMVEGCHLPIFDAWGFRPISTAFTWVKTNANGSPYMGIGFYTRGDSELCLLGIKGSMKVLSKRIRQTIISPRMKHSAKPNIIVRSKITELFGNLPRIELFARPPIVEGWDMLGNEIDQKDIRDSLKEIITCDPKTSPKLPENECSVSCPETPSS